MRRALADPVHAAGVLKTFAYFAKQREPPHLLAVPRLEQFLCLLATPALIFTTHASTVYGGEAWALASISLVLAGALLAWGGGWVVLWQLLLRKTLSFKDSRRDDAFAASSEVDQPGAYEIASRDPASSIAAMPLTI